MITVQQVRQVVCSWRKQHVMAGSQAAGYYYCTRCSKGWYWCEIWHMWREDTEDPNSNP